MLKQDDQGRDATANEHASAWRSFLVHGRKWAWPVGLLAGAGISVWCLAASRTEPSAPTADGIIHTALYPVVIRRSEGPPLLPTGLTNYHGQPVFASCGACHATTQPNLDVRRAEDLDQFHQGLNYNHGGLTCLSCHNSANYDTLRLADTRSVEFPDSITLCSQCHGPQRRDYDMGLHGGMSGHWDLERGGRTRNTCINCHDPHAPAFPQVMPVLPPRDRVSVPKPRKPMDSHP